MKLFLRNQKLVRSVSIPVVFFTLIDTSPNVKKVVDLIIHGDGNIPSSDKKILLSEYLPR